MFRTTAEALAASKLSVALQDATWVVPVSQSIHIVSLSVLFASAMMINLRLLGVGIRGRSVSTLVETLVPWMWRALLLCLATGVLQTVTEPVRQFITPIFWWKLVLIALMAVLTSWLQRQVRSNAATWDGPARPKSGAAFAIASTIAWLTIAAFGRFIGYVWGAYL